MSGNDYIVCSKIQMRLYSSLYVNPVSPSKKNRKSALAFYKVTTTLLVEIVFSR
jgi:hypothetical protein